MLKPGGSLLMFEPNADYFLQFARRIWYKVDGYFESDTEGALSHARLLELARDRFACEFVKYLGGPAFFLVYNSLVFRVPLSSKQMIAPVLMTIERAYNRIPGRWPHSSFLARWMRLAPHS
jgi:hypothetical protein